MSTPKRHSLRVVVQHICAYQHDRYRLVAYGDAEIYSSVEFSSLEHLEKALHSVVPDFDMSTLSIKKNALDTYIVFVGK